MTLTSSEASAPPAIRALFDRKREVSRSPVRSIASGSPGARSNTSSIAPSDVRSVESASVSPLVKRENNLPNETRPLSASNNNREKGGIENTHVGSSDTSHKSNSTPHHHSAVGLSSRSTSANDLPSTVKKEDANEITVIGEKEGLVNGRPGRSSLSNHISRDHHHSSSIHGGHLKHDNPSRHHGSTPSSLSSSALGSSGVKQESRRPLSNPSRDSNSVKPPSISQSSSLASSLAPNRSTSELLALQQQAAAVSIASSIASGVPYPSIPGLPPPGYPGGDPRAAAALGLLPGLNHRAGAATPLPHAGGFGAPGLFPPGMDHFRDPYLAAAAMGATNPYLKDPLREAREREMMRLNPLGSMIMSEHDRARMALGYPSGLYPPPAPSPAAAGLYGMSAALAAGAASKIPPHFGAPGAASALGAPHLGMYSAAAAGLSSHSALAALGASGAGIPGLTPPLTPTVNGHGGPSSTAPSPALSRDTHHLAR